jgi:flagellar motor switch protein FliM
MNPMGPLNLNQDSESPQQRHLRGVHETFATALAGSLSAFLQAEIGASLEAVSFASAADFKASLQVPACLITFQLEPRPESAVLSFDAAAVFGLLELLLGGQSGPAPVEARGLTEIEWSLLEEVVRVLAAALGESWKTFHAVEFKVQALDSDPAMLAPSDPALRIVRMAFRLQIGEQSGTFEIAAPQTFFDIAEAPEIRALEQPLAEVERNLALLGESRVELEVILDGPTMVFEEIANLAPGHVVQLDYPLQKPLRAVVNGTVSIPCQIVSAGRKRAFQVRDVI